MNSLYVIGADFGTDSVRCILVDTADGKIVACSVAYYPRWKAGLYCDAGENRYRQHPLDYIESFEKCVRDMLFQAGGPSAAGRVAGISFDTTASTPVLVSREGTPLSLLDRYACNPDAMFMLWKDHTAIQEADMINEAAARWETDYTHYSGGSYSCEWVWAKVLHALKSSPELVHDAYSWVEHCDWMAALLSGDTRPENIARSRCAAGHKAMWHESWGGLPSWDFLESVDPLFSVFRGHLYDRTFTSDCKAGTLCGEWASRLGLKEGIAIGVGAIDCHFGAVGAGIVPGALVKVMGTSTCDIAICSPDNVGSEAVRGICGQVDGSVVPGYIGLEAGQAAFGDVYAWFSSLLEWPLTLYGEECRRGDIIAALAEAARKIPVTEDDIVALDWFNGRRTPDSDQRAKARITGLSMAATAPHIFKALVEATAFGSRAINERFREEGVAVGDVIAVGGISMKSPYVMQTMADVLGVPIRVSGCDQACALGAAMFASVAAGIYPDILAAQKGMGQPFVAEYRPDAERHAVFDKLYDRYCDLAYGR